MPIIYEITATVRTELCDAFERFMTGRHVPDLITTGAFRSATFSRSSPGRYRIRYEAHDRASLENYLVHDAAGLREHFMETFPEGIAVTREEWEIIETFSAP